MSDGDTPLKSIISFTQDLVRTPSQAYTDDPQEILGVISNWAKDRRLDFHSLRDAAGKTVGGYLHCVSSNPGPSICLDACVDTCPFGAPETWNNPPASGLIEGDYLHGRGAADSKIAVSLFCHLFDLISRIGLNSGQLYVLLDADEHTGNFGGVKAFLKEKPRLDAVFIGYPGDQEIMIGARGFLRAKATVYGQAAHSGSRKPAIDDALLKMTELVQKIYSTPLPIESDSRFANPKVTITAVHGGEGFSQIADKADINIDMRITPNFNCTNAAKWLQDIIDGFNAKHPDRAHSTLSFTESWPAYALEETNEAVCALQEGAQSELGRAIPLRVSGPSNIGNYLAAHDIPALCGFGVDYKNLHGANETVRISSIEPVYKAYHGTIRKLCP